MPNHSNGSPPQPPARPRAKRCPEGVITTPAGRTWAGLEHTEGTTAQQRQQVINAKVLANEADLGPSDNSVAAQQIRGAAEQIRAQQARTIAWLPQKGHHRK